MSDRRNRQRFNSAPAWSVNPHINYRNQHRRRNQQRPDYRDRDWTRDSRRSDPDWNPDYPNEDPWNRVFGYDRREEPRTFISLQTANNADRRTRSPSVEIIEEIPPEILVHSFVDAEEAALSREEEEDRNWKDWSGRWVQDRQTLQMGPVDMAAQGAEFCHSCDAWTAKHRVQRAPCNHKLCDRHNNTCRACQKREEQLRQP